MNIRIYTEIIVSARNHEEEIQGARAFIMGKR